MKIIILLYLAASTASIIATLPQIKQLVVAKCSDELSLISWSIWGISQCITMIYSVYISAVPLIIANSAWILFYLIMVILIIKYRKKSNAILFSERAEITSSNNSIAESNYI